LYDAVRGGVYGRTGRRIDAFAQGEPRATEHAIEHHRSARATAIDE
jgi:hypothetical protein